MSHSDYVDSQRSFESRAVPFDDSQNDPLLASPSSCLFGNYSCSDTVRWNTDRWWWCILKCKVIMVIANLWVRRWGWDEPQKWKGRQERSHFNFVYRARWFYFNVLIQRFYYIFNADEVMCIWSNTNLKKAFPVSLVCDVSSRRN